MSSHSCGRFIFIDGPLGLPTDTHLSLDKLRIPKSLHTSHPLGATPLLHESDDEKQEASFIAHEIKRCVANMGGVLGWRDFVVLRELNFFFVSIPISF